MIPHLEKMINVLELLECLDKRQETREFNINLYNYYGFTELANKTIYQFKIGEIARIRLKLYFNKLKDQINPL